MLYESYEFKMYVLTFLKRQIWSADSVVDSWEDCWIICTKRLDLEC